MNASYSSWRRHRARGPPRRKLVPPCPQSRQTEFGRRGEEDHVTEVRHDRVAPVADASGEYEAAAARLGDRPAQEGKALRCRALRGESRLDRQPIEVARVEMHGAEMRGERGSEGRRSRAGSAGDMDAWSRHGRSSLCAPDRALGVLDIKTSSFLCFDV